MSERSMRIERESRERRDESELPEMDLSERFPGVSMAAKKGSAGSKPSKRNLERQATGVSATEQLGVYLAMPPGESRKVLMQGFLNSRGGELTLEELKKAALSFGDETSVTVSTKPELDGGGRKIEIPADETELKLFLRERSREVIRVISNDDNLTYVNVRDKIIAGLGFDPKTFTPVDLFATLPVKRRDVVQEAFEAEIQARCVLRAAELKEQSYKAMADKGAAVNRYMNDMKGSESGGASAAVLDRDTYVWLKTLKNEGDGLERKKIDRALAIFVTLGEREPDFSEPWARPFEKYRPKKKKAGGEESWGSNFYDPSYDRSLKTKALAEIESAFGKDAVSLAWQMFQAFKEEGNYNWQHYLARDFTFASSRHALATLLTPPVYIGSRRVYATGKGAFKDELERVALSALRVKTKTGEDPDPAPDDPERKKDRLERDVFLKRAIKGVFLAQTPFDDQNIIKEGKLPQQLSYASVKDGEKLRAAIVTVGELGKDQDKGAKIGAAIGALTDLRSYGQSLVEAGVVSQEELNQQIAIETRNMLWELSIENPANVVDLGTQSKAKPSFLTPSQLNVLFEKMGGSVAGEENMRFVGSDDDYAQLADFTALVRKRTLELLKSDRLPRSDSDDGDRALVKKEDKAEKLILPKRRGVRVMGRHEARNENYFVWLDEKLRRR